MVATFNLSFGFWEKIWTENVLSFVTLGKFQEDKYKFHAIVAINKLKLYLDCETIHHNIVVRKFMLTDGCVIRQVITLNLFYLLNIKSRPLKV